jgi:hypothetical protein
MQGTLVDARPMATDALRRWARVDDGLTVSKVEAIEAFAEENEDWLRERSFGMGTRSCVSAPRTSGAPRRSGAVRENAIALRPRAVATAHQARVKRTLPALGRGA